ncbi:hypothetical protein [Paenibacillus sp. Cedars]|nr:hypothetical protein [Paenibacillus sp. Cedars]
MQPNFTDLTAAFFMKQMFIIQKAVNAGHGNDGFSRLIELQ